MKRYSVGDESYGGIRKGERVAVGKLVDPKSDEGSLLFRSIERIWLDGRSEEAVGVVADFLADDMGRPETLICVSNPDYGVPTPGSSKPGCLAVYLVRELVRLDLDQTKQE